jgi:hypothetical protein
VRPDGVVVDAPLFDDPIGLAERREQVLVQALVAEPAIEAFDEGVLRRFARRDVVPFEDARYCRVFSLGTRMRIQRLASSARVACFAGLIQDST